MNYLSKMYSKKLPSPKQSLSDKNPNRVTGGLKGQGVDHVVMIGEDGSENQIPTQRYVASLEEQLRKQRSAIQVLERKVSRQDSALQQLNSLYSRGR